MEEKKISKKEVYASLEETNKQLRQQLTIMYSKIQEMNASNMFKRLDYLFKVVELNNTFSSEFVEKCVEEIVSIMTIPEEPDEKEVTHEQG